MDELRVVLIGVGQRAEIAEHVGATDVPARLVAAVDPAPHGRDRAAARFGSKLPVFARVEEALALGVDAAIVTTPDDTHAAVALPLLEAGVAVYLVQTMTFSGLKG